MRNALLGAVAAMIGAICLAAPVTAADYAVLPLERAAQVYQPESPYCGARCGCPIVTHVRHRRLMRAYPASFDPRERDEPRYYYGAMKTYARYERSSGPAAGCAY